MTRASCPRQFQLSNLRLPPFWSTTCFEQVSFHKFWEDRNSLERILALRKKVDEVDERILYCLRERVDICKIIGDIKRKNGIPIRDFQREDDVYSNIFRRASELRLNSDEVRAIYQKIMDMSTHAQKTDTKT
jgi:chorismate mutase